jgi:hypothetical protein
MSSTLPSPSNLEYWVKVMNEDSANPKLNSFSLEEKYKIIEYAYNKIGIRSNIPFEQLKNQILNEDPWDDIFRQEMQINKIAYWIFGLWGSYYYSKENSISNWSKISDQIWYYDGEQSELEYLKYVEILHKMRPIKNDIFEKQEAFDKESSTFHVQFKYKEENISWSITNESPGWINSEVFKLYTDLCEEEYIKEGNYFMVMEGQGGYLMYLSYDAEQYLRTLWDFPKLNAKGRMMTLNDYGKL